MHVGVRFFPVWSPARRVQHPLSGHNRFVRYNHHTSHEQIFPSHPRRRVTARLHYRRGAGSTTAGDHDFSHAGKPDHDQSLFGRTTHGYHHDDPALKAAKGHYPITILPQGPGI